MDRQYKAYIRSVAEEMETFMQILDQAFVMDVHVAFEGSIKLARACGVPSEEILDTRGKIFSVFYKMRRNNEINKTPGYKGNT